MRSSQRRLSKSYLALMYVITVSCVCVCVCVCRQASLRYRELNDALETVQEKLRDARVCCVYLVLMLCMCIFMYIYYM